MTHLTVTGADVSDLHDISKHSPKHACLHRGDQIIDQIIHIHVLLVCISVPDKH